MHGISMQKRLFSTYRYSVFMSYSHHDDKAWNGWISSFGRELKLALEPRLRGIRVPPIHLIGDNIQGVLDDGLRQDIDASFAMLLVVHDNYLESEWCLQELRHFRALSGEDRFRDRLYIVAMSEDAMQRLQERPTWREFFAQKEPVWMNFFEEDHSDRPIAIYPTSSRQKQVVVATEFWNRFVDLRESLAGKIKKEATSERRVETYPTATASDGRVGAAESNLVKVYIEANREQENVLESLGQQVAFSWEQVVALECVEPPLHLRPSGLPIGEIDQRPLLGDADGVVLLWGKKTPDSLAAQINQVEPKLSGPHFAPGLVAYIMENPNDHPYSNTINNWPVVRFAVRQDSGAIVLAADVPILAKFLRNVLKRKRDMVQPPPPRHMATGL
jgi:hypothetical protein